MLGAVGTLLDLTVAAPIGLAVGLTLGRKLVRHERERQVEHRRQLAKQELRRYVDEVTFHRRQGHAATRSGAPSGSCATSSPARARRVERSAAATAAAVRQHRGACPSGPTRRIRRRRDLAEPNAAGTWRPAATVA